MEEPRIGLHDDLAERLCRVKFTNLLPL